MAQITDIFASPDEQLVAILGNTAAQNFFSRGVVGNGFIVLSDRRVYFRGRCLRREGKRFIYMREDRTVDVENVTGTGFVHFNHVWMKILGIIFAALGGLFLCSCIVAIGVLQPLLLALLFGGAGMFFLLRYKATKMSVFEIAFAGGGFGLDVRMLDADESAKFQKAIKLAGDSIKRKEKMYGLGTSAATELSHLAELVEKGLISREEFEAQKAKLLHSI